MGGPKESPKYSQKKTVNIPLVPPNSFGPPPMGAVGPDFKDRAVPPPIKYPEVPQILNSLEQFGTV